MRERLLQQLRRAATHKEELRATRGTHEQSWQSEAAWGYSGRRCGGRVRRIGKEQGLG